MHSDDSQTSRRRFLQLVCVIAVAAPAARVAQADDLPHVSESDATAAALGYHEDAAKVDTAKFPQHKPDTYCGKCEFFVGTGAYAPCQLFPGKAVNAKGWCSAYAAKA
jgi:hypothetical protein